MLDAFMRLDRDTQRGVLFLLFVLAVAVIVFGVAMFSDWLAYSERQRNRELGLPDDDDEGHWSL